jgi:dsRNA-specific ribonuclease
MNKFKLFHSIVSTPDIQKYWISAALYGQKITSKDGYDLISYNPKSMALIGDGIIRAYMATIAYATNPQGSAHLLSSHVSSMVENEYLSFLYDSFNMSLTGPRVSHIKPKADSVEQLVGLIFAQWGFDRAWLFVQLLYSTNDELLHELADSINKAFGCEISQDLSEIASC